MTDVFFYVQHLLGIGHQKRASLLAKALTHSGLNVSYVSGGENNITFDIGDAQYHQLPEVKASDSTFSTLLNASNSPIDDRWREQRKAALLTLFKQLSPRSVLLEGFPFARWQFRFELIPLLEECKNNNIPVFVSVRDILVEKKGKPERTQQIIEVINQYANTVIVHSDPAFVSFEKTFPGAQQIANKLFYSGYVADKPSEPNNQYSGEVVISIGGGAVGGALLKAAIQAKEYSKLRKRTWRIFIGPNLPEGALPDINALPEGIKINPASAQFSRHLTCAEVSVSQAGYNTVMDILTTGVPSVVVPFAGDGSETEQPLRAKLLAQHGLAKTVDESNLTPKILATAIDDAWQNLPKNNPFKINMAGATSSAKFIGGKLSSKENV